ncbi:error-prone DNA polymerase [Sphingosinicella sp. LY1275]|uniref:error-prone DNA polymerase n=1 Tax=Sphingosinicella sp. LY1275 TaxID=3095379 RepID=UPI002ADED512|nr:error-prone DNA polymerase [Sphingosinicella sp. LY1275]MEA1014963.1 error-prone DNA polymerase [Sphingosinicella sp. LY1275]
MTAYVELEVSSHFSFLRGASSAEELFSTAAHLSIGALGIVDRNSVAGMVRCWEAAKATGVRLVPGCRIDLVSGDSLLLYPQDRRAWSRLTRLLSAGRPLARVEGKWLGKSECRLDWDDVARWSEGMIAALVAEDADQRTGEALARLRGLFGDRAYAAISYRRRPGDVARIDTLDRMARAAGVAPLATGDVLYHAPERRMLQDVLTATRHNCTIDNLGFRRERYADRHLKSAAEMERLFQRWPHMIAASREIVARCRFDLGDLSYQYPSEAEDGQSPQATLEERVRAAAAKTFPDGLPPPYEKQLRHELALIERLRYAPYFLTVHAIVEYARSKHILCQGRGSAANSVVCFLLGITSIDPIKHELLFERFVSGERNEPPDIDVDFEHERREEVIQWIYEHYGRERAALTAVVTRYRARGAVRDVGKALGLSEDVTGALAGQIWGWSSEGVNERHVEELNLDRSEPRLALTLQLARELIGTPRHLSQHPGGFVLTQDRLDDLVPIAPATMEDRRVIEWDKDDIDALKFMKVDVLGLGMLGCMRRAFDLLDAHKGLRLTLASDQMQEDDPLVYDMICKADTLGVFQIESRAQMSMLPRLKPREFYDIVIQVAIVRPGPIQGDMVHPYLRRREGKEKEDYPSDELRAVLEKTKGVPLFQEQAMKVAIVGAGFTPAEADGLRRSMATFKYTGGVGAFRDKLVNGMLANGYMRDFAERTFRQIEGFGSYGFPESHAASFAKIAYASSWMKCHHPDIFCAALLNAQPMGFYAPAQIVRDARDHGVEVRPVCVNQSLWDCTLEGSVPTDGKALIPLRLGMRMVSGLSEADVDRILAARAAGPFASVEDVWRRSGVPRAALERIANADGFQGLGFSRRQALWQVRGLRDVELPLFAAARLRESEREPAVSLRPMTEGREVVEDYRHTQLSLRDHPLAFLRGELEAMRILPCAALAGIKDGRKVEVAGIILVRQRPGKGNVTFITIEDETGIANIILWQRNFEAQRRVVMASAMISVKGTLQREGDVIHVIADRLEDRTPMLRRVGDMDFTHRTGRGDGATHGGGPDRGEGGRPRPRQDTHALLSARPDPENVIPIKSRDFH